MQNFGDVLTIIGIIWCIYLILVWYTKHHKKSVANSRRKICPYCAESIREKAKVCRYCEKELPTFELNVSRN